MSNAYGVWLGNPVGGGGTVRTNFGIYIGALTAGIGGNWALYAAGTAPSYVGGNLGVGAGLASYATNLVLNTAVTGFTNSTSAPGIGGTNAMVVNIQSTSGTMEIYWKSGAGGATVCGTPVVTNTLFSGWDSVVIPVNCGFVIRSRRRIRIDAAAF